MRPLAGISLALVSLSVLAGSAWAQKPPALVGAAETFKATPPSGFIDDVVATDDQRIAYVVADASTRSELHVVTLADKSEIVVDLAPVTMHATAITLVGARAFVVGTLDDGRQMAALVELMADAKAKKAAGAVVYKLEPATHISLITRDGKPRIAVHRAILADKKTRHELDLVALDTGKRLAAGKTLELDANNTSAALELHVNHWANGYTQAIGIKAGTWDRKTDARMPDTEATYDLVAAKITPAKITDLFENRRRFQALAEAIDKTDFVRLAWDNSAVQIWKDGRSRAIELDQPLLGYDPKSLQGIVGADGAAWFILKVDPVNAEAVARKKADLEYLDVFRVGATDPKAVRKVRLFAPGARFRFGVVPGAAGRFWLIERNIGFERGGKSLTIYQP